MLPSRQTRSNFAATACQLLQLIQCQSGPSKLIEKKKNLNNVCAYAWVYIKSRRPVC